MEQLTFWQIMITFLAGIVSLLSPCIIPILPGFIAYFAGISLKDSQTHNINSQHKTAFIASLFFSLGFTIIFLAFGLVAGGLSLVLVKNQLLLQEISGAILMILGIMQTGLIKLEALQKEFHPKYQKILFNDHQHLKSFIIGALFAFSWTPCYGPIIGGIFTLSASSQTIVSSLLLFFIYSLGFTLPIILLSLSLEKISTFLRKHRKLFYYANAAAGFILIIIGFLIFTNNLSSIVNWLSFLYTANKISFY